VTIPGSERYQDEMALGEQRLASGDYAAATADF
jgi:hypothetical protein